MADRGNTRGRGRGGRGGERGDSGGGSGRGRGGNDRGDFGGGSGRGRGGNDRGDFEGGSGRGRGGYDRGDRGAAHAGGHQGGGRPGGGYQDGGRGGGGYPQGGGHHGGGRGRGGPFGGRGGSSFYNPSTGIPTPDESVNKLEDGGGSGQKAVLEIDFEKLSISNKDRSLPERPGFGTQGKKIILWTNYLKVEPNPATTVHRYSITMTGDRTQDPEIRGRKRTRIIQLMLEESSLQSLRSQVATDFKQILYCTQELKPEQMTLTIRFRFEKEDIDASSTPFVVSLQKTGAFSMDSLLQYLSEAKSKTPGIMTQKNDIIQALNIIFGHQMKNSSSVLSLGGNRHFAFPKTDAFDLGAGLQAWTGFLTSVRTGTARVLLNVQIKHIAVYDDGHLVDAIKKLFGRPDAVNPRLLEKYVRLLRVQTSHLPEKRNKKKETIPRVKTIFALARVQDRTTADRPIVPRNGAGPEDVKFKLNDESRSVPKLRGAKIDNQGYISVAEFFLRMYGIKVDARLPVLNVGTREKPTYLPADVCSIVKGQPAKAKLSPNQTAAMIRCAVQPPARNALAIKTDGISSLQLHANNGTLAAFRVKVGSELLTVHGRILHPPPVRYARNNVQMPSDGQWNMARVTFTKTGKRLSRWAVVRVGDGAANDGDFKRVLDAFCVALVQNGVTADRPIPTDYRSNNTPEDISATLKSIAGLKCELVLVFLPQFNMDEAYKIIKTLGDVELGLSTVCLKHGTVFPSRGDRDPARNLQLFANVALKFNLKLGGINQHMDPTKLHFIQGGKTMLVGLDVTHPSPGSARTAKSVAAMVASTDALLGQWPAVISRQPEEGQEEVAHVRSMLTSRLQLWKSKNKEYPENILVYRDGVSEGQYAMVLEKELPEMREACKALYPATQTKANLPRFTIAVVGKRHNTRFYPTSMENSDRSSNTPNGTVVDRGVTESANWDFFLQAHAALHGTARPAHYFVVIDEILHHIYKKPSDFPENFKTTADVLEDLTHNMCYLFGRATRAVSVCPPAYYADLVCERARIYYRDEFDPEDDASSVSSGRSNRDREVHPKLRDTMFYI